MVPHWATISECQGINVVFFNYERTERFLNCARVAFKSNKNVSLSVFLSRTLISYNILKCYCQQNHLDILLPLSRSNTLEKKKQAMELPEKDYQLTVKAFQSPCKIGAALMGWEWGGEEE